MNRRTNKAFTLVELLVVIAVIAILVTIIIGVARKVSGTRQGERTRITMTQIMDAIEVFQLANPDHRPPADWFNPPVPAIDSNNPNDPTGSTVDPNWRAYNHGGYLLRQLATNAQSKAKVPTDTNSFAVTATSNLNGRANFDDDPAVVLNGPYTDTRAFIDGYGKFMDYLPAGGVGGTPLLISAGPDGQFGTEDDIRSDRR